jgi:hypothetical protein
VVCHELGFPLAAPAYNLRLGRKSSSPFPGQDHWNFRFRLFCQFYKKLFSSIHQGSKK